MKRIVLLVVGVISTVLGTIGIILPVLPTTPFLLLALWCFLRSSEKFYNYIINNKYLGPFVRDYVSGKGISMGGKIKSVGMLWITIGFSAVFIVDSAFMRGMLGIIAVGVTTYILTRKTARR